LIPLLADYFNTCLIYRKTEKRLGGCLGGVSGHVLKTEGDKKHPGFMEGMGKGQRSNWHVTEWTHGRMEALGDGSIGRWKHWEMEAWKMEAHKQTSRGALDALPHLAAMPSLRRARCPMGAEIWEQGQGPSGAAMKSLGRRNPNWC